MDYIVNGGRHTILMLYAKVESGEISPKQASQAIETARKNRPWYEKLFDLIDGGDD